MNIRNKISAIIVLATLLIVVIATFTFDRFFTNYLEVQEDQQLDLTATNLGTFMVDKLDKYLGSVNDYGHWDDPYDYLNYNYPTFVVDNLQADVFSNLEMNFWAIVDTNGVVRDKRYFDLANRAFIEFPAEIDIGEVLKYASLTADTSGIIKFGDQFYFVATTWVTDTYSEAATNGIMLLGRQIDQPTIEKLNSLVGGQVSISQINSINPAGAPEPALPKENSAEISLVKLNKGSETSEMGFILPADDYTESAVVLTVSKARNLYIGGVRQMTNFSLFSALSMFLVVGMFFALLGMYIRQPFKRLIADVRGLDFPIGVTTRLEVRGKDEFAFVRSSINTMLASIKGAHAEIDDREEKLRATLNSVGDGVIAVGQDGRIDFINPVAQKLTGWNQVEAVEMSFKDVFETISEQGRKRSESAIGRLFETGAPLAVTKDTILISKAGLERPIEQIATPIVNALGQTTGVVLVFRDVSQERARQKEIEYLSYHDQLTGLYNRRFFEEELNRLDIRRNLPLTILFTDIDGLKTVNDAFGHHNGDLMIKAVAAVCIAECRADDIIARTGGDEFIFLLPRTDSDCMPGLVNRIREKIELQTVMGVNISVSYGWATKNNEDESAQSVMTKAEDAMYQKKGYEKASKRSAVIKSILNTLYLKSPRENAHSHRVSRLCEEIGKALGFSTDEVKELKTAGELHDIGKIAIDEVVLNKPGQLNEEEWVQIRRHPETGFRILMATNEYHDMAEYIVAHHERWDGRGYPKGLKEEAIDRKARIIALADAYDAMTCVRPYRRALSDDEAVVEIQNQSGTQFDPEIVRIFVEKVIGKVK